VFLGLFGVVLGFGFVTRLVSAAFWVLVLWTLSSPRWRLAVMPLFVYGAARPITIVLVARAAIFKSIHPANLVHRLQAVTPALAPLQATLVVLSGALLLVSGFH
jgi:hypothetical protein